jgi:hypothetical protein
MSAIGAWVRRALAVSCVALGCGPPASGFETGETTQETCELAELGCACDEGDCAAGLECVGGLCVELECWPGALGCACNEGHCLAGLHCMENECVDLGCVDGELGCPCNAGECLPGLDCVTGYCIEAPLPDPPPPAGELDCTTFDPREVYIQGTYHEALAGADALAHPSAPRVSCAGFSSEIHGRGVIRPSDGKLLWVVQGDNDGIHVFTPDALVWQGGEWSYPQSPEANDGVIPTPDCQTLATRFVVDPFTDSVLYTCDGSWFRSSGEALGYMPAVSVLSALADGQLLTCSGDCQSATLELLAPDSSTTALAPPGPGTQTVVTTRHRGAGGVWLVVTQGDVHERWVLADALLVAEGPYAAVDEIGAQQESTVALDDEGRLIQQVRFSGIENGLVRRPLASEGQTELIYDEREQPAGNSDRTQWPFVYMHGSELVTGP